MADISCCAETSDDVSTHPDNNREVGYRNQSDWDDVPEDLGREADRYLKNPLRLSVRKIF